MNRTVSCTIQISYIIVFILFYCIPASAQINDVPPELKNRIYLDGNFGLVGSGSAYYERHLYRFKYNRVKLAARIGVGHNYYIMYNDPVKNFISTGFTILIGNYKHNLDLTGGLFAGLEGKDKSEETPVRWLKSLA